MSQQQHSTIKSEKQEHRIKDQRIERKGIGGMRIGIGHRPIRAHGKEGGLEQIIIEDAAKSQEERETKRNI